MVAAMPVPKEKGSGIARGVVLPEMVKQIKGRSPSALGNCVKPAGLVGEGHECDPIGNVSKYTALAI